VSADMENLKILLENKKVVRKIRVKLITFENNNKFIAKLTL
jgi:hypothetical protein